MGEWGTKPDNGLAKADRGNEGVVSRARCSMQCCFAEPGPSHPQTLVNVGLYARAPRSPQNRATRR